MDLGKHKLTRKGMMATSRMMKLAGKRRDILSSKLRNRNKPFLVIMCFQKKNCPKMIKRSLTEPHPRVSVPRPTSTDVFLTPPRNASVTSTTPTIASTSGPTCSMRTGHTGNPRASWTSLPSTCTRILNRLSRASLSRRSRRLTTVDV